MLYDADEKGNIMVAVGSWRRGVLTAKLLLVWIKRSGGVKEHE